MNFRELLYEIISATAISSLYSLLVPKGKWEKPLCTILGLCSALLLISPFVSESTSLSLPSLEIKEGADTSTSHDPFTETSVDYLKAAMETELKDISGDISISLHYEEDGSAVVIKEITCITPSPLTETQKEQVKTSIRDRFGLVPVFTVS